MFQRKAIAHTRPGIIAVEIGNDTWLNLNLLVADVFDLLVLDVLVLKINACSGSRRNDVGIQHKGNRGNDGCRNGIGYHQPPETHAGGQHGNDFGMVGQLRCEEDNRNEGEQRTEQIRIIGNEVQVVIENDGLQRHIGTEEFVDFLIDVEHDSNGNDQQNRKHVGPEELLDDVSVDPF